MAALQLIGVTLAAVAAAGFALCARLLGADGRGWRDAPLAVIWAIDAAAGFWVVAAVWGATHRAVITGPTVCLALLFAVISLVLTLHVWRGRRVTPD